MRRSAWRPFGLVLGAALLTALSACAGGGEIVELDESHDADRLIIRDFIGTLTIVTTEPGGDIAVHVAVRRSQQALLPIGLSGDALTIAWEGEPDRTRRWWEFWRGRWMADLSELDRYPTVEIAVPADVEIEIDNFIGAWTIGDRDGHLAFEAERGSGTIGTTETAAIAISGDAEIELGPVTRHLDGAVAGSGTLRASAAGSAELSIAGSGEVALGDVAGGLTVNIAGSGGAVIGDTGECQRGAGRLGQPSPRRGCRRICRRCPRFGERRGGRCERCLRSDHIRFGQPSRRRRAGLAVPGDDHRIGQRPLWRHCRRPRCNDIRIGWSGHRHARGKSDAANHRVRPRGNAQLMRIRRRPRPRSRH